MNAKASAWIYSIFVASSSSCRQQNKDMNKGIYHFRELKKVGISHYHYFVENVLIFFQFSLSNEYRCDKNKRKSKTKRKLALPLYS
jgi:hypothetical protein